MSYLSPTTLTADEQQLILRATAGHPRDHLVYSLALGTGLRLAEIVGLNVGDVFLPGGAPPGSRPHPRRDRQGRPGSGRVLAGPARGEAEAVPGVEAEARRVAGYCRAPVLLPVRPAPVQATSPVRMARVAATSGLRPFVPASFVASHRGDQRLPSVARPVPGPAVRPPRQPAHDDGLHPPLGPGDGRASARSPLLTR